jgi:hypothetical protein
MLLTMPHGGGGGGRICQVSIDIDSDVNVIIGNDDIGHRHHPNHDDCNLSKDIICPFLSSPSCPSNEDDYDHHHDYDAIIAAASTVARGEHPLFPNYRNHDLIFGEGDMVNGLDGRQILPSKGKGGGGGVERTGAMTMMVMVKIRRNTKRTTKKGRG